MPVPYNCALPLCFIVAKPFLCPILTLERCMNSYILLTFPNLERLTIFSPDSLRSRNSWISPSKDVASSRTNCSIPARKVWSATGQIPLSTLQKEEGPNPIFPFLPAGLRARAQTERPWKIHFRPDCCKASHFPCQRPKLLLR